MQLKDRIIELRRMKAADIAENPLNWREHPEPQRAGLRAIVDEVGIADALIAYHSERNDMALTLIDGHLRRGEFDPDTEWPVMVLDVTDEEADKLLASLDPLAMMAHTNADQLRSLQAGLNVQSEALAAGLAAMNEALQLAPEPPPTAGEDTEPQIDKAEELRVKWGVESGQLWQIGEHRLICGDCTDPAVVSRVMGGERADCVVTDPPYGVEYADKNAFLNAIGKPNSVEKRIENDHLSKEAAQAMWKAAFDEMVAIMRPGAVIYCFMPQGGDQMMMMMMMMMNAGIEPRHELIWLKNNHVLGRVDYAYKHEPILYAWKDGGHKFYGDFQTSILEFPKPQKSDLHPTMKPTQLLERLITNSSEILGVIYEPFSGSGTTIIACENLGRRCRAIEIDPGYVAVALERWAEHTGKTPELIA